jgi:glutamate--cysteine ligase
MVPHLVTALSGPINELEQRILESMPAIERWFRLEWMEHTPAFYCSVDIRNAGYKLAPVASSLFPAGFANLTPEMLPLAVQAAMAAIEKICPEARNLLLIPDAHNANPFYHFGVRTLTQVFHQAGLHVRLGSLDPALKAPMKIALPDGDALLVEPILRQRGRLGLKDFDPCTILLNSGLHEGIPDRLQSLHEQYLLPPLHAGWTVRRKSRHFQSYEEVAKRFAKLLGMDPWLIHPMFANAGPLDLTGDEGIEPLRAHVEAILAKVRRKYKEYGIGEKPFVLVKAGDGSHAIGWISLRDPRELDEALRRLRQEALDGGRPPPKAHEIIVQEGVPTYERINDAVAEPVVYTIDRYVVGGFYRVHAGVGIYESLNAPGSMYVPLAFEQSNHLPRLGAKPGASPPNRFYMYGVIARLAMLAASYELEATDPEAELDE